MHQQIKQFNCLAEWLNGWLFNGKSTQKGQVMPTAGEENDNNVTLFTITVQLHKRNNRLSNRMTYLLIIKLAPLPIPSHIPHTLFNTISLGVDAVL